MDQSTRLALLFTSGMQLSTGGVTLFLVRMLAAITMALWPTFVAVTVSLVYPHAATTNSHPQEPIHHVRGSARGGPMITVTTGIDGDPLLVVGAANVVPLLPIGVGWTTVRRGVQYRPDTLRLIGCEPTVRWKRLWNDVDLRQPESRGQSSVSIVLKKI